MRLKMDINGRAGCSTAVALLVYRRNISIGNLRNVFNGQQDNQARTLLYSMTRTTEKRQKPASSVKRRQMAVTGRCMLSHESPYLRRSSAVGMGLCAAMSRRSRSPSNPVIQGLVRPRSMAGLRLPQSGHKWPLVYTIAQTFERRDSAQLQPFPLCPFNAQASDGNGKATNPLSISTKLDRCSPRDGGCGNVRGEIENAR